MRQFLLLSRLIILTLLIDIKYLHSIHTSSTIMIFFNFLFRTLTFNMKINSVYLFAITGVFLTSCITTPPTAFTQRNLQTKSSFGLLEISSFDIYTEDNALHLLISGTSSENTNSISVRYLKSIDQGEHWSKPVDLGTNPPTPLATRGNDVQIAARAWPPSSAAPKGRDIPAQGNALGSMVKNMPSPQGARQRLGRPFRA